jgi:hypothetical protein
MKHTSLLQQQMKIFFNAIMEARQAREGGESGQDEIDKDPLVDPIPSCAEAIHAALIVSCYTMDKGDPILQEVEPVLASFRWQAHVLKMSSMKETKITYFI